MNNFFRLFEKRTTVTSNAELTHVIETKKKCRKNKNMWIYLWMNGHDVMTMVIVIRYGFFWYWCVYILFCLFTRAFVDVVCIHIIYVLVYVFHPLNTCIFILHIHTLTRSIKFFLYSFVYFFHRSHALLFRYYGSQIFGPNFPRIIWFYGINSINIHIIHIDIPYTYIDSNSRMYATISCM